MVNSESLVPGRELDSLVAERIGLKPEWVNYHRSGIVNDIVPTIEIQLPGGSIRREMAPNYSTDISAAMPLAIKHQLSLIPLPNGKWFCGRFDGMYIDSNGGGYFNDDNGVVDGHFQSGYAVGKTPAHAICLAFLAIPDPE